MTSKLRAAFARCARSVQSARTRIRLARYTLLQLLGAALVVTAVEMVSTSVALGLAGLAIFAAAYFLEDDGGDDDD